MSTSPEHTTEDRLIDLLNGLLAIDDERAVLEHLKSCAECEGRFVRMATHHETLKARPVPALASRGRFGFRRRVVAGGALVAAVAAVLLWIIAAPTTEPGDGIPSYWMTTADDERTIRARDDVDELRQLALGIQAYRERNLETAMSALDAASFDRPQLEFDMIRRLYLASAQVNSGLYQAAGETLSMDWVVRFPHPWRQRARWVLYLAARGSGDDAVANELLAALVEGDGEIGALARAERERLLR